jgi:hypothetical protein
MNDFLKRLIGGKTRSFATLAMALTMAQQYGLTHLTPDQYHAALVLLGGGVAHGLRDAVDKVKA